MNTKHEHEPKLAPTWLQRWQAGVMYMMDAAAYRGRAARVRSRKAATGQLVKQAR